MMPYNANATDANQFRNLRQKLVLRVQGQMVNNGHIQLVGSEPTGSADSGGGFHQGAAPFAPYRRHRNCILTRIQRSQRKDEAFLR